MATAAITNTFINGVTADADEVNTNFQDLVDFLNNSVVHRDGSKSFTGVVSGVAPSNDAHLATKGYVDGAILGSAIGSAGARMSRTTSTTYNSGQKIELTTVDYNPSSIASTVVDGFTVTSSFVNRIWLLWAEVLVTGAHTFEPQIRENGSTVVGRSTYNDFGNGPVQVVALVRPTSANATYTIHMGAFQANGAPTSYTFNGAKFGALIN